MLTTCQFGGGIDRSTGFIDDGVFEFARIFGNKLRNHFFRFATGRTVADHNNVRVKAVSPTTQSVFRFGYLITRRRGIHGTVIKQGTILINDSDFATCSVTGIKRNNTRMLHGLLL